VKLNEFFDRVVVINLDRRQDRLKELKKQTKSLGIDFVRYSAVDAKALGISNIAACATSHRFVLEDAKAAGAQRLLILEDDAEFGHSFTANFSELVSKLPENWQMFYLGSNTFLPVDIGIEGLRKTDGSLTTHAYGVKAELYDTLIQAASDDRWPVDLTYSKVLPKVRAYAAWPSLIGQRASYSDIENRFVDYGWAIR